MNSTTTQPPAHKDGGVAVSYVLVPLLLITIAGIATALIVYLRRKRRVDRLRHQLLPVYTYDPAEELHEAEQELLWREEDTRRDYVSWLACEHLGLLPEEQEEVSVERGVWVSLLRLLPLRPGPR